MSLPLLALLGASGCETTPTAPTPPAVAVAPASAPAAFTLTLDLGPSCGLVPERERVRSYDASIGPAPGGQGQLVTLHGPRFLTGPACTTGDGGLAGVGCHQFRVAEDLDLMSVWLDGDAGGDAHGGTIVEQLESGGWIAVAGAGTGPLTGTGAEVALPLSVWYCGQPRAHPFPCAGSAWCPASAGRLTFARR